MLRLLLMGVVVPTVIVTSFAAWAGAIRLPPIDMPQPATLLLLATGIAGYLVLRRGPRH